MQVFNQIQLKCFIVCLNKLLESSSHVKFVGGDQKYKRNIIYFLTLFRFFFNFKLNLLQYRIGPTLFNHLRGLRAGTMFWLIGYMQLVPIVTVLVILKYIIAV